MVQLRLTRIATLSLIAVATLLAACSQEATTDDRVEFGNEIEAAEWTEKPIVPELEGEDRTALIEAVEAADEAGNRPGVFAKVGDSNSDFPANLYGLGCRPVEYGPHRDLAPVRNRFATELIGNNLESFPGCRPVNSFSRDSVAAVVGAWTEWVITPIADLREETEVPFAVSDLCPGEITPLECELRRVEPRYALIMIGSNDVYRKFELGAQYRESLEDLIESVRGHDVVPVISTIVPMTRHIEGAEVRVREANEIIAAVAEDESIPLINLWRAMNEPQMINRGLGRDGVHLNVYGGEDSPQILRNSVVLTDEATRFGANRRNLIWLQTLDRLERTVDDARSDGS